MDRYALFGHAVDHSLSPYLHQLFAIQTNQTCTYEAQSLPVNGFSQALSNFFASGGAGANVTAPFKQQAYDSVDQLTTRAQSGAVNTVIRLKNGHLLGDNSDGIGLVSDLQRQHMLLGGERILLIGAGGAARGILLALLDHKPGRLVLVNRTHTKAAQLAAQFIGNGPISAAHPQLLQPKSFDLIIHATSASTFDAAGYHWLLPLLWGGVACYDLNYQKRLTPFLSWVAQQGVTRLSDGLGMLVEQAAHSFQLWHQVLPDAAAVLNILRREWRCW